MQNSSFKMSSIKTSYELKKHAGRIIVDSPRFLRNRSQHSKIICIQWSLPNSDLLICFPNTAILSLLILLDHLLPMSAWREVDFKTLPVVRDIIVSIFNTGINQLELVNRHCLIPELNLVLCVYINCFTICNKCLFKADWGKSWHSVPFISSVPLALHLSRFYLEEAKIASSDTERKS